ncbi:phenylalanine--tRNA ligase subunit beta [Desertibaculum subflavum]|uniref:phenylalanine--tRNA ligase subunit beta n=1 Tax=Desertibaculum subflavum TaxID=2268458 RepID=UPI000E65F81D
MKFTLRWLKEHLDTTADTAAVCEALTGLGLEVEGINDPARDLAEFVVGYVVSAEQHPNADRLRVCKVDIGKGDPIQVVCGAPNARTGMKGVFARSGLRIPGTGLDLKASSIRGQASNGMLCSAREMGISDEHEGIIELAADAPVGKPFAPFMGLDDPAIEIKLTPNRPDCLGVRGIARDLAAKGLGKLKPLDTSAVPGKFDSPIKVRLDFAGGDNTPCPLFVGRYVRGVTNGPSPEWLQKRLRAIGLRPISALVDITNLITYDLNRPLHVFDADKVKGDIRPRLAKPGEELLALDGKTYKLDGEVCVIADDNGPEGLGGVMGGEHSGVTPETKNVFIEAALFDPVRTAATGRKLGINSDARYRFERGVDPEFVVPGMEVATRLVIELCSGEPSHNVIAGAAPEWRRNYRLRGSRVRDLGGLDVPLAEQQAILGRLGFETRPASDGLDVVPPAWRPDVHGEADLVEEVTRVVSYDAVPAVPLPRRPVIATPAVNLAQRRVRIARRALAARGLVEAVTYSFIARAHAEAFGGGRPELMLANPIAADLDAMRPSILPGLIAAAGRNVARGIADVALFEVGPQYGDDTPAGQRIVASGIRRGQTGARHWQQKPGDVDAFLAKADAAAALAQLGIAVDTLQSAAEAPAWYHPGRSGALKMGPKTVLAWFGELHPAVLEKLDVRGPLVGFEVFLDALPAPKQKAGRTRPPLAASDFPAVERDFAFVVDRAVAAGEIVRAVRAADRALIADASVFDLYEGPGVAEGKKSVAVAVRLEPKDRTLTDAEIEATAAKVVASVAKQTGASLR